MVITAHSFSRINSAHSLYSMYHPQTHGMNTLQNSTLNPIRSSSYSNTFGGQHLSYYRRFRRYKWKTSKRQERTEYYCPNHETNEVITYSVPFDTLMDEMRIKFIVKMGCIDGYNAWKFAIYLGGQNYHYSRIINDPKISNLILSFNGLPRWFVRRLWNKHIKGIDISAELFAYLVKHTTLGIGWDAWRVPKLAR
jgi:hypothetical protein